MASLKCVATQESYILDHSPFKIGRSRDADIVCLSLSISRNHCELRKDDNGVWNVFDAGSQGTRINGKRIKAGADYILNDGDLIQIGEGDEKKEWKFSTDKSTSSSKEEEQLRVEVERLKQALDLEQKRCEERIKEQTVALESTLIAKDAELAEMQKEVAKSVEKESLLSELQKKAAEREQLQKSLVEMNARLERTRADSIIDKELAGKRLREQREQLLQLNKAKEEMERKLIDQAEKKLEAEGMVKELAQVVAQQSNNADAAVPVTRVEKILESELECSICNELFITAVTLNCTHTFCRHCLTTWKHKICPICRATIVSENRALVLDNYIEKMVESLSPEFRQRRQFIVMERRAAETQVPAPATRGGRGNNRRGRGAQRGRVPEVAIVHVVRAPRPINPAQAQRIRLILPISAPAPVRATAPQGPRPYS